MTTSSTPSRVDNRAGVGASQRVAPLLCCGLCSNKMFKRNLFRNMFRRARHVRFKDKDGFRMEPETLLQVWPLTLELSVTCLEKTINRNYWMFCQLMTTFAFHCIINCVLSPSRVWTRRWTLILILWPFPLFAEILTQKTTRTNMQSETLSVHVLGTLEN